MAKPTIHFAYSVPLGAGNIRRAIDKAITLTHMRPLHRGASDFLIPWQQPIRAPHSITHNLLNAFKEKGYPVKLYSFYEHTVCNMKPGDIFAGMALPSGGMGQVRSDTDDKTSVTSRTLREFPSNKNFIILPYAHDDMYVNWQKELIAENAKAGGGAIMIGGEIWERDWQEKSPLKDISPIRKTHVIMGIDPADYAFVKTKFNPKGKRRYLYIGHTAWYKNTAELERIAAAMPEFEFAHIGGGDVKGWKKLANFATLTKEYASKLAEEYDVFVNTSTADPQATTILEQMCFGLVVASTPETGYEYPSLVLLSTTDTAKNVALLKELQYADESELRKRTAESRKIAETRHTWNAFTKKITDFMNI